MEQLLQALQAYLKTATPMGDQASHFLNLFVFFVQWAATILSALTGLYQARKHGMDVYGALVIAFIVALGGGTVRDILLGRYPIFWVANPAYAVTVVVIAILAVLIGHEARNRKGIASKVARPVERLEKGESKAVWYYRLAGAGSVGLPRHCLCPTNGNAAGGGADYGDHYSLVWRGAA